MESHQSANWAADGRAWKVDGRAQALVGPGLVTPLSIIIQTTCEIVSCKVDLHQLTLIYISSSEQRYYIYMESLCGTIENMILDHPNSTIWIAGDLHVNLSNVNWSDWSIHSSNYSLSLCNLFTDLLISYGFS